MLRSGQYCMEGPALYDYQFGLPPHSYDEELAMADAREREVKLRVGFRTRQRAESKKQATWK